MARPAGLSDSEDEDIFDNVITMGDYGSRFYEDPDGSEFKDPLQELLDFERNTYLNQVREVFKGNNASVLQKQKNKSNSFSKAPFEEMRFAAMKGNIEDMENVLTKLELSVDQVLSYGWTSLMFACSCGKSDMVKFLLDKGANPNMHKEKFTALMAVCSSSSSYEQELHRCLKLLIESGAHVSVAERHGVTPLMFACQSGNLSLVEELLNSQANINAVDHKGWTAICWAADGGYSDIVKLLIERSAVLVNESFGSQRPSVVAERAGHKNLQILLEKAESGRTGNLNWELTKFEVKEEDMKPLCPELELVLAGIGFRNYLHIFQKNEVDLAAFLRMEEKHFIEMGIKEVGVRLKLEEAIKEIHKSKYSNQSMPDLTTLKYLTISEASSVVENIIHQVRYLHASVAFLREKVETDERLLQLNKEMVPLSNLVDRCNYCVFSVDNMSKEMQFFKRNLDKVANRTEYEQSDLVIHKIGTNTTWKRKLVYSTLCGALVCTVIYTIKPSLFSSLFTAWKRPPIILLDVNE